MTLMKTVAPESRAHGHIGKAIAVVLKSVCELESLHVSTYDIGSSLQIDVLGEHRCEIDTSRNSISSNIDTKLGNQERECYPSERDPRENRIDVQAKKTAALAPDPPSS